MADKYLGKDIPVYLSSRKTKKFMVITPDNKAVHFGAMGYEDYTKHKSEERRQKYRRRAENIKGNWKQDKYSPNNLAINILW